ncbi:MAG: protein-L-isoaspartate O-methyltransferase [Gammaproteobacteria bacterium]|jgi:protein-L-isoaspartate(D-aspartate) O-methyltransferase
MSETDMEQARFNMIEQQIRPAEVLDTRVLNVIAEVPREFFVPDTYQDLAFADVNIPLPNGQQMMSPIQEARLLQALDIQSTDTVLEIGTGSGYLTALLAKLSYHVTSIEIDQELSNRAAQKLRQQNITNVTLDIGDGADGWPSKGRYDVIAVTGSMPVMNDTIKHQLKTGGRLFVIVGTQPAMSAQLITRISDNQWSQEELFETVIPPLLNVETPSSFVF